MKTLKIVRIWAPVLSAVAWLSCQSVGNVEPIVIDISATKPPTAVPATPTPPSAPTPTPAPAPPGAPSPPPAAPSPAAPRESATSPTPGSGPEAVAGRRIDAYNNRDLEPLVSLYAPDARIFDPPDRLRDSGLEQIRQSYSRRFSSPDWSRLESANRMVEGNFVVEREIESGPGGRSRTAIVISEIRDGKIIRVWILR